MKKKEESRGNHTALYRKHRPRSLDEIVSQPQITEVLKRSLAKGKVAHAYLLTGPKGVGKTSIARIMAYEINSLPYSDSTNLDIIEIDAASNNSVDDVRDLREKVQLAPIAASKKVYIIDEVHMLSKSAFNALLKTLEEPPAHVVFILATTDLHKVPATIISRTQHFALHSISLNDLAGQLRKIADSEGIAITDEALAAIAARGDGSFRNSISLLDQLSGFASDEEGITLGLVRTTLGLAPSDAVDRLLTAVNDRDAATVISQLDELEKQGIQPTILADQLITSIRAKLADQPQLVTLLDALLGVASSSQAQLKLLAVLVGAIKPKATAAAAVAAKPRPTVIEAPVIVVKETERVAAEPPVDQSEAPKPTPKRAKKSVSPVEVDWPNLLDYTKSHLIALHSVLSKCDYEFDGTTLTLYTGRKFNKTKLDEAKYLAQLNEALAQINLDGVDIVTLPTAKPPTDEGLARIAAMMGGGKEVSLEDMETTNG